MYVHMFQCYSQTNVQWTEKVVGAGSAAHPSLRFIEIGQKKEKYAVSSSFLGGNDLCMPEVRGECTVY